MKVIHKIVLLLLVSLAFAALWRSFSATAQTDQKRPVIVSAYFPNYPPVAKLAQISGEVKVQTTIDSNGRVTKAEILGGHRLLNDAALDAVKQWKFEPEKSAADRTAEVILRFTLMPRCSDKRGHTPIFHFPYTAEIRQEKAWMSCDDCSPEREKELNCSNP